MVLEIMMAAISVQLPGDEKDILNNSVCEEQAILEDEDFAEDESHSSSKKVGVYRTEWMKKRRLDSDRDTHETGTKDGNKPCNAASDEKAIVQHHNLGNRQSITDTSILVEMTAFSTLGKLQPFHVSCSSAALMVVDFHSHITSSEVVGYLAGVWDVNAHNLIIMRAFPCLSRLGDRERAPAVEMAIASEIEKRRLQLVGWYHSHPSSPATPSVRDIDMQLEYEIKMKGSNDTAYKPCIGLICSPYHRADSTVVTTTSSVACYWVTPPSESRPQEVARPMSMQHNVLSDPSLADDILDQMQRCAEFYKGTPDAINFEEEWVGGVSYIDKLKGSLEPKLRDSSDPRILDYVESLLLSEEARARLKSIAPKVVVDEPKAEATIKKTAEPLEELPSEYQQVPSEPTQTRESSPTSEESSPQQEAMDLTDLKVRSDI